MFKPGNKLHVMNLLLAVCFFMTGSSLAAEDPEGEALYKTHCSSCHGIAGGMDMRMRIAPPIAGVRLHYIERYPDEVSFVEAVVNWVEVRDPRDSLMRGAVRRFGVMPDISVPRELVEKIAAYIFAGDIEKPAGFDRHVEQSRRN